MKVSKTEQEFCAQLQGAGIEASLITDKNSYLEKLGEKIKKIDSDIRWVCDVNSKEIDYIFCIVREHRYSRTQYLDYIVVSNLHTDEKSQVDKLTVSQKGLFGKLTDKEWWRKKVLLERRTSISLKKEKGRIVDIEWEGDFDLAQKLNSDFALKQKVLECYQSNNKLSDVLFIYYEPKYNYGLPPMIGPPFKLVPFDLPPQRIPLIELEPVF